jgi:hypothetical protein
MPPTRTEAENFSAGGYLKTFRGGFLGLNAFRASHTSSTFFQKERAI